MLLGAATGGVIGGIAGAFSKKSTAAEMSKRYAKGGVNVGASVGAWFAAGPASIFAVLSGFVRLPLELVSRLGAWLLTRNPTNPEEKKRHDRQYLILEAAIYQSNKDMGYALGPVGEVWKLLDKGERYRFSNYEDQERGVSDIIALVNAGADLSTMPWMIHEYDTIQDPALRERLYSVLVEKGIMKKVEPSS